MSGYVIRRVRDGMLWVWGGKSKYEYGVSAEDYPSEKRFEPISREEEKQVSKVLLDGSELLFLYSKEWQRAGYSSKSKISLSKPVPLDGNNLPLTITLEGDSSLMDYFEGWNFRIKLEITPISDEKDQT